MTRSYPMLEKVKDIVKVANENRNPVTGIPTMLQPQEQMLLYLLAKDYYSGTGAIFDAGICLGGCTDCFAKGLNDRVDQIKNKGIIYSYELGIADGDYVTQFIYDNYKIQKKGGDSFVDIIEKNISEMPQKEHILFTPGDILEKPYPTSIEIMFLDVCKTQAINYQMQKLFANLIPDQSVLIQQDYFHSWHPYIHATMGYLKDYFYPIGPVYYGSFVFLYKKQIPEDMLNVDPYASFSVEDIDNFIREYFYLLDNKYRNHMEMVRAFMYFEKGQYDTSLSIIEGLKGRPELPWDFDYTCEYIKKNIHK